MKLKRDNDFKFRPLNKFRTGTGKRVVQGPAFFRLYGTLLSLYWTGISRLTSPQQLTGRNGFSDDGPSAFILTVAIWESYLHSMFFSIFTKENFGPDIFYRLLKNLERLRYKSLLDKTWELPKIAFGKTFERGAAPFQSFRDIVSIRNGLTHDYMHDDVVEVPENALQSIRKKGILLDHGPGSAPPTWHAELAALEAIRWCINTLNEMEEKLHSFSPVPLKFLKTEFHRISDTDFDAAIDHKFFRVQKH